MGTVFGPQRTYTPGSTEVHWATNGQTVWRAYWDGTTHIKVDTVSGQGYGTPSTATVDTNAADNDVMLNEPIAVDPVSGKIHVLFGRNANSGSNPAVLLHSVSSDGGATWSATPHTLDDGTIHGNGRFYRVGIAAYNDYVTVAYTSSSSTAFTSDGLYEVHSSDAGATWSSPAKLYTSPVCPGEPNLELGADGTVHLCWGDPGSVANAAGDLYYASATFNGSGFTWPGSATRLTTSETWGRGRIFTSNGVVMIVGNTNWGGSVADVSLKRSTDNGASWSASTVIATHSAGGPLDHPDGGINSELAMLMWVDQSTSPISYAAVISTDAGATWGSPITPLTTTGNSDAPRLVQTDDLMVAVGYDNVAGHGMWAVYPLYSAPPAITAIIDNFNRANENPLSDGGKWSTNGGGASAGLQLLSNAVTRQSGAGTFDRAGSYRNDISTSGSFEVYVDTPTDGGSIDIYLWDPSAQSGYWFDASDGDSGVGMSIAKFVATVYTALDSTSAFGLTSGDTICLRLDQNCVVGLRKTGGNWSEILRAADTTYRSSRRPALDVEGLAAVPVADNFGGGQLFAPVNTAAPAITGTVGIGNVLSATYGTWATDAGKTPTRYKFQWQQSTNGGASWSDISRATLRFEICPSVAMYRVNVTAYNSFGSATATSAPVGGAAISVNSMMQKQKLRPAIFRPGLAR